MPGPDLHRPDAHGPDLPSLNLPSLNLPGLNLHRRAAAAFLSGCLLLSQGQAQGTLQGAQPGTIQALPASAQPSPFPPVPSVPLPAAPPPAAPLPTSPVPAAPLPAPPAPAARLPTLPCAADAPDSVSLPADARPPGLTGRLGFYAAEYDPLTLTPLRAVSLDPGGTYPLASAFKTTVLHSLLAGVDDGRFRLSDLQTTTEAARSIERYSRGTNTLLTLAARMIHNSENTAADLLTLRVGPARIQADLDALGAQHTRIQFTTKAWWSIQAGLVPALFPPGQIASSARRFSQLAAAERLNVARQVLDTVKGVNADLLDRQLDLYFKSPEYRPDTELYVQNTSTPQEYACLNAVLFSRGPGSREPGNGGPGNGGLSPSSMQTFRRLMATGLDHAPFPAPQYRYWGGKPGSGWRLLTLTGYAETASGRVVAYAFFNDRSDAADTGLIERQLRGDDAWIRAQVEAMLAR